MMLDLISKFDHFSGSSFLVSLVYWTMTLATLVVFLNGSTFWLVMNWGEAFVLGFLAFDPADLRESRAFSDPGYSVLVCSAWLTVGYTGFLSLCPYYDDMAREPAFIYSITMVLWWYALLSYGISSFRQFWYGLFLSSKSATYFILLLFLETVSWISRGMTFGARFVVSGMFGTGVSYALAGCLSVDVNVEEEINKDDLSGELNIAVKNAGMNAKKLVDDYSINSHSGPLEEAADWWFMGLSNDMLPMLKWQYSWSGYSMIQVFIEGISAMTSVLKELFCYLFYSLGCGSSAVLLALTVAWNFYELAMTMFQCYLIGLLGICFCIVDPMSPSDGKLSEKDLVLLKRENKIMTVWKLWKKSF
uniref:ATP synthase F0 subunit 6 n=1 Tax=Tridacna maxima TaxID=80832 RepID=A0A4Y5QHQ9_TRIMX|nr:ATP synthase F0 subunit 6 [Tridacna maxima]